MSNQHTPACNFWQKPIGSPGCICAVVLKSDLIKEGWELLSGTYYAPLKQKAEYVKVGEFRPYYDYCMERGATRAQLFSEYLELPQGTEIYIKEKV